MSKELIERLREYFGPDSGMCGDAADAIESLAKECGELRAEVEELKSKALMRKVNKVISDGEASALYALADCRAKALNQNDDIRNLTEQNARLKKEVAACQSCTRLTT